MPRRSQDSRIPAPETPVYVISVAAELTGLHAQTLRTYDRLGLVSPGRTAGGGRRYSWRDVESLRTVAALTADGIGLEGVKRILDLQRHISRLETRLQAREARLAEVEYALAALMAERGRVNLPVLAHDMGQSVVVWRRRP